MSERIIIGETERAGWPLSQPPYTTEHNDAQIDSDNTPVVEGTVRFKIRNAYFVLQQYRRWTSPTAGEGWVDVAVYP